MNDREFRVMHTLLKKSVFCMFQSSKYVYKTFNLCTVYAKIMVVIQIKILDEIVISMIMIMFRVVMKIFGYVMNVSKT